MKTNKHGIFTVGAGCLLLVISYWLLAGCSKKAVKVIEPGFRNTITSVEARNDRFTVIRANLQEQEIKSLLACIERASRVEEDDAGSIMGASTIIIDLGGKKWAVNLETGKFRETATNKYQITPVYQFTTEDLEFIKNVTLVNEYENRNHH